MPKVKPLGLFADRKDAARRVINTAMARNDIKADDLDRRKVINKSTFFKRKRETDTTRLGELWMLDKVLHFTDDEILQFFGRGGTDQWKQQKRNL